MFLVCYLIKDAYPIVSHMDEWDLLDFNDIPEFSSFHDLQTFTLITWLEWPIFSCEFTYHIPSVYKAITISQKFWNFIFESFPNMHEASRWSS